MDFLPVALVSFAAVMLYRDQDAFRRVRTSSEGWLARKGWSSSKQVKSRYSNKMEPEPLSGVLALVWRFLWRVVSCPYCLGVYATWVSTVVLSDAPVMTSVEFWTVWWSAWAVFSMLMRSWLFLHSLTKFGQANSGD